MTQFRSGFVGLAGRPSVGKSTILNYFLKQHLAITSDKPQTTRHRLRGIVTRHDAQVVFIDCPGWHRPQHALGRYMADEAKAARQEADVLVAVVDAERGVGAEDRRLFDAVTRERAPGARRPLLAVNKIDRVRKPLLLPLLKACADLDLFEELIPVSAVTGQGMGLLLEQIVRRLPEGPAWYDAEQVSDQTPEQQTREAIREQIMAATRQEVPHAVGVLLEEFTPRERSLFVRATILVERDGQKTILIGRNGLMLKRIGTAARINLQRLLKYAVFLELWVKVARDWRNSPSMLRQLGYR